MSALIVDARGENARLFLPYPDDLSTPEFTTFTQKINEGQLPFKGAVLPLAVRNPLATGPSLFVRI
ncbi:MAG: hypothetical protein V4632_02595 [Pseudomonadota bacterium]